MHRLDLLSYNNVPFVFAKVLVGWGLLYDLMAGSFRVHLRRSEASAVVHYSWTTANGRASVQPVPAAGLVTFTDNPEAGQILQLGNTAVTFVGSPGGANTVVRGATLGATLAALMTFLTGSADSEITKATYSRSANAISIVFKQNGEVGNAFALIAPAGATASGETLANGGHLLTLEAPVEDIATFLGHFVYDCRFEDADGPEALLFGGTMTFLQGVTR